MCKKHSKCRCFHIGAVRLSLHVRDFEQASATETSQLGGAFRSVGQMSDHSTEHFWSTQMGRASSRQRRGEKVTRSGESSVIRVSGWGLSRADVQCGVFCWLRLCPKLKHNCKSIKSWAKWETLPCNETFLSRRLSLLPLCVLDWTLIDLWN